MDEKPNSQRRWFRFSLRTLLLVVTVACVGFGWMGHKLRQAERQREAVAAIRELGAWVHYDSDVYPPDHKRRPSWLRQSIGEDVFANVVDVRWERASDDALVHLAALPKLEHLNLAGSEITDNGLTHLRPLKHLRSLDLASTKVTDTGLMHLRPLEHLHSLDLASTTVTDMGLIHIRRLHSLLFLSLLETDTTDKACNDLKKALPSMGMMRNFGWPDEDSEL